MRFQPAQQGFIKGVFGFIKGGALRKEKSAFSSLQ
jgi:hypothetical protein